jgi:heme/copper-type cytochrome/quinol oxidase subunit 2
MPVEVNRPIHFSLSADAPMSAFWIPAFGSQIYTMNGMSSQLNLMASSTGDYMGYTTNINGRGYADMKFVARSMTSSNFDAWIDNEKKSKNIMNESTYQKLIAPTINDSEKTYRLDDQDIYKNAVLKYMKPMTQMKATDNTPMEMDHSMHSMEGM